VAAQTSTVNGVYEFVQVQLWPSVTSCVGRGSPPAVSRRTFGVSDELSGIGLTGSDPDSGLSGCWGCRTSGFVVMRARIGRALQQLVVWNSAAGWHGTELRAIPRCSSAGAVARS
jgi:hypothetical protein